MKLPIQPILAYGTVVRINAVGTDLNSRIAPINGGGWFVAGEHGAGSGDWYRIYKWPTTQVPPSPDPIIRSGDVVRIGSTVGPPDCFFFYQSVGGAVYATPSYWDGSDFQVFKIDQSMDNIIRPDDPLIVRPKNTNLVHHKFVLEVGRAFIVRLR